MTTIEKEMKNMGFNLKEVRKRQKMTQQELAIASGVCRAIISGIESGRIVVTTTGTLRKLANALGVSIGDIFTAEV